MEDAIFSMLSAKGSQMSAAEFESKHFINCNTNVELLQLIEKVKRLDTDHVFKDPITSWETQINKNLVQNLGRGRITVHLNVLVLHLNRKNQKEETLRLNKLNAPFYKTRNLSVINLSPNGLNDETILKMVSEPVTEYARTDQTTARYLARHKLIIKQDRDERLKISEETSDLIVLVKFIAKEEHCNINELIIQDSSGNFLIRYKEKYKKSFEERKQQLQSVKDTDAEAKTRNAYDELMASEEPALKPSKQSSNNKKSKKSKRKKNSNNRAKNQQPFKQTPSRGKVESSSSYIGKSSPPKPYQSALMKLNTSTIPSKYKLHPRVLRWQTLDLKKIREFEDRNEKKNLIHSYKKMDETDLKEQKAYHNLIGLERILNFPDLMERYTFTYTFETDRDEMAKTHRGRVLFGQIEINGKIKNVIVRLAIDEKENLIYHMHTSEIKKVPSIYDLCKNLGDSDGKGIEKSEASDSSWEIQGSKSFDIDKKDNTLKMTIKQTGFSPVTFSFLPLDMQ